MGPGDTIEAQHLVDLPTTVETADSQYPPQAIHRVRQPSTLLFINSFNVLSVPLTHYTDRRCFIFFIIISIMADLFFLRYPEQGFVTPWVWFDIILLRVVFKNFQKNLILLFFRLQRCVVCSSPPLIKWEPRDWPPVQNPHAGLSATNPCPNSTTTPMCSTMVSLSLCFFFFQHK